MIRLADADDAAAIRRIRNDAVEHSTAIWTSHIQTGTESRLWLAGFLERASMWVAESDGTVVGFACWGPWREKDGYRFTVESSVYVLDSHQGHGLGHALMSALIPAARASGAHVIIANIEAGNHGSIALHRRLGFTLIGTLPDVGTKFDRWLGLTIMHLAL